MLRVVEHAHRTDTGRQRPANEDSFLARSPLFAVADGMGGAQAGEVASRMAVDVLQEGLGAGNGTVAERLTDQVATANSRIFERSRTDQGNAGMGTTLTAAYVDTEELVVVHVGDSRLYRYRAATLERLTDDHSLVEELVRQGRLTPEEAAEHPQRSIITRALGPESEVAIDSAVMAVEDDDLFLLCSDGLTTMVHDDQIADLLGAGETLAERADALVDAANAAGGRDNITVLLFRVERTGASPAPAAAAGDEPTEPTEAPAATLAGVASTPAQPTAVMPAVTISPNGPETTDDAISGDDVDGTREPRRKKRRGVRAGPFVVLFLVFCLGVGAFFASQTVYFIGNDRGLVTVYRGLPYELPFGVKLYTPNYYSSVPVNTLEEAQRERLLDHRVRSLDDANDLVSKLERGEVVTP
ncbi:MAG: Stp1/IreP family PP2C-type Ser/Thr phosphatase [Patulibacter sp.]|nr:Stp1/IreP family PP2C-type Ser/Thr phosphatase [Patulibacter sp.]